MDEKGHLVCSVNETVVIDLVDTGLKSGRVGLVKFRQPSAEFRRFRFGKALTVNMVDEKMRNKALQVAKPLADQEKLEEEEIDRLVSLGSSVSGVLRNRAKAMEKEAKKRRD